MLPKILIFGERRKRGNSLEERGFSTCCKPLPTKKHRLSHERRRKDNTKTYFSVPLQVEILSKNRIFFVFALLDRNKVVCYESVVASVDALPPLAFAQPWPTTLCLAPKSNHPPPLDFSPQSDVVLPTFGIHSGPAPSTERRITDMRSSS